MQTPKGFLEWVSPKSNIRALPWVYSMCDIVQWFAHYSNFSFLLFSSSFFLYGTHLCRIPFFKAEYMLRAVQETLYGKTWSNKHCFKCPRIRYTAHKAPKWMGIVLKHSAPLTLSTANQSCLKSWKCREQPILVHFKDKCLSSMSLLRLPDSISRNSWQTSLFLKSSIAHYDTFFKSQHLVEPYCTFKGNYIHLSKILKHLVTAHWVLPITHCCVHMCCTYRETEIQKRTWFTPPNTHKNHLSHNCKENSDLSSPYSLTIWPT